MDANISTFVVYGPVDGVVLIQSPVTTLILIAAAIAVKENLRLRDVPVEKIQEKLV